MPGECLMFLLLRRRIVAGSPECVEGRQPPRLYQFDTNLPILAVTHLVGRAITKHILISQLNSNFRRHIRQFVQIFDDEVSPPVGSETSVNSPGPANSSGVRPRDSIDS